VRELRNFVERSLVLQWVDPAPMSQRRGGSTPGIPTIETPFKVAKDELVAGSERRYVSELLRWSGGKVGKAAQKAGIDRMYLYRLMQRHGMKRDGSQDD
jgi:DNA-binding NtrC family response regulator